MIRGNWRRLALVALAATAQAEIADPQVAIELARQLEADGLAEEAARERLRAAGRDGAAAGVVRPPAAPAKPVHVGPKGGVPGALISGIVLAYRTMVRPAIGVRCSLSPSCSEYFRQAGARHGLLAFPLIADRLVREPGLVASMRPSLGHGGRVADPLSHHDFWHASPPRPRR